MSESTLQRYLIKKCKKLGGIAVKVDCKSIRGWPDITMVLPGREIRLVEVKSDTIKGVLSDPQIDRHAELAAIGIYVTVVETKEEVDRLLIG